MKHLRSSWLRVVALAILTILFNQAQAQVQTARFVSMGSNTNGYYEYLPLGYNVNTSQTYPLILFVHGMGELGDGSPSQLPRLLNTGIAASINVGEMPVSLTVNGQTNSFIVISPQFVNWPSPADIDNVLNYAVSHYRVNTSRVYLSGLSMGGGAIWEYAGASAANANRIAAMVPLAGASWPDYGRARTIATANIAVWALHNNYDPQVPVSYTNDYIAQINQAPAPTPQAKKTIFEAGGHDCWTNVYNSNYKENNMSIYQWMLQFQKGTPPPIDNNQLPVANAGVDQNVSVSSVQLSGSGSDPDGTIASYSWSKVSGPSQFTFSSASAQSPVVSNLTGGTYTFRLTVTDNKGATAYDDVVIKVISSIPGRVEAESFSAMSGIQTENTADAGGGQNVGWQENNDWMDYTINVTSAGSYNVNFRVATANTGVQFQLRKADGSVLATVTAPNTGGWQTWQNVSANISLAAGQQTLRIYTTDAKGSGWNINWMDFTASAANQAPTANAGADQAITLPTSNASFTGSGSDVDGNISSYQWSQVSGPSNATISAATSAATSVSALVQGTYTFRLTVKDNAGATATDDINVVVNAAATTTPPATGATIRIEAESYTTMSGIQTENTGDAAGGGKNVGWQENNDWMDYAVNLASAGTYVLNFRVATVNTGVQFQLRKADGSVLTTVTVPNTGGWQAYQTISASVTLPAGQQTLRIFTNDAKGSGWNFNWWEIADATTTTPPPPPTTTSIKIEAESFTTMSGIQTENTGDAGGGLNVGWQENNDWMDYSVNIASAGTYTVNFRVATVNTGVQFQLRKADGSILTTVTVPNTGWWQTYQTVSASVTLPAGQQTLRIFTNDAKGSGWNFNWWEIAGAAASPTPPPTPPATAFTQKIEAESYTAMNGIKTENTWDAAGGGLNVGWQENNDWMDYSVNLPSAGTYTLNFRVATVNTGVQFQLRKADGSVLTTVTVPNTGGWQAYQIVSASVTLPAGQQTLRIFTSDAKVTGWNFNWWEITTSATASTKAVGSAEIVSDVTETFDIYPNPITDRFSLTLSNQYTGNVLVEVISISGAVQKQFSITKQAKGATQTYLSIGDLPKGEYILKATIGDWSDTKKIIKL